MPSGMDSKIQMILKRNVRNLTNNDVQKGFYKQKSNYLLLCECSQYAQSTKKGVLQCHEYEVRLHTKIGAVAATPHCNITKVASLFFHSLLDASTPMHIVTFT